MQFYLVGLVWIYIFFTFKSYVFSTFIFFLLILVDILKQKEAWACSYFGSCIGNVSMCFFSLINYNAVLFWVVFQAMCLGLASAARRNAMRQFWRIMQMRLLNSNSYGQYFGKHQFSDSFITANVCMKSLDFIVMHWKQMSKCPKLNLIVNLQIVWKLQTNHLGCCW